MSLITGNNYFDFWRDPKVFPTIIFDRGNELEKWVQLPVGFHGQAEVFSL